MTEQSRPEPTGQGTDRDPSAAATPPAPEHASEPSPAHTPGPTPAPAQPTGAHGVGDQPTEQFARPSVPESGRSGAQPTGWPPPWPGHQQPGTPPHPAGPPHTAPPHTAPPPSAQPTIGFPQAGSPGSGPFAGPYGYSAPAPAPAAPRRTGRLRLGVAGLVAGALIGGGAGAGTVALLERDGGITGSPAAAQQVVIRNPETATTATAAAAKAAPSVVTIYVRSGSAAGSGSGVVLTDDGFVLTNNHVVTAGGSTNNAQVQVRTADGAMHDASVVGTDPTADLAVVKLDGVSGLTPATFGDSDAVQVGDLAVAIGAPLGLSNTVTDGIISATNRAVATGSTQNDSTVIDALQTDAAINPGNSGGALVNAAGEVVGINTAIATVASGMPGGSDQSGNIGVGFAIPSNTANRIATEIIETGSAQRALLGVSARTEADDTNSGVGTGARIVSVEPGSAAADAGLQAGDVVTALGNRPITTSTELTAAVRSRTPGERITLTIRRGNDSRTVDVTLGAVS